MIKSAFLLLLLCVGTACQDSPESISIRVCPAVLAADAGPAVADWDSVAFTGSQRATAGTYRVATEPLFTEWNIIAFHTARQPDGTAALTIRLNAHGARKLSRFTAESQNQKKPLAVQVDGEWVDFVPVLTPMSNNITLYGFTPSQVQALRTHLDSR